MSIHFLDPNARDRKKAGRLAGHHRRTAEAEPLSHNPVNTLLQFLQLGLYVYSLVLLFHRDASGWFGTQGSGPG
jgi:hypothetical protein